MVTIQMQLNSNYAIHYYLDTHLWQGARDRWNDATYEQKQAVVDRIEDYFDNPTDVEINDFVWFDCDDIFFPEDNEPVDFTDLELEGA